MTTPSAVRLTAEQLKWIDEQDLNFSKFVRRLIDNEIERRRIHNDA